MFTFDREAYRKRVEWFQHDRFGMFIHWGLYAIPARGEWVRSVERISAEDYEPFFREFNPVDYDPKTWAFLAKLLFTAVTLGAGFQGGEVTPLFGIGAALGGWIGCLVGIDPSFLAALGMLGVFCAGLNVPITTCMMAIDLFHGTAAGFFVIVAFISYLVGGHRGVYPAQRIISPKRRSLIVDEGGTVADAIERHNDLIE